MKRIRSGLNLVLEPGPRRRLPKPSSAAGLAESLAEIAAVALTQAYLAGELWRRRDGSWRSVTHWARQDPV